MNRSPINYTGGKYKLLPQILPFFPERIETFVDLFCGGCDVGINVSAKKHVYNDCSEPLIGLYKTVKRLSNEEFLKKVCEIIEKYQLSQSAQKGYGFYECESSAGLSEYNKPHYLKLRDDFNARTVKDDSYYVTFYVLIVYAFNNQIRFNSSGKYNLPVGKRDFNKHMEEKLLQYAKIIKKQDSIFECRDFRNFDCKELSENDFVYADPPYLITCAAYNEKNGWTEKDECDLLDLLDYLDSRNTKFALSNVTESKGKKNHILQKWLKSRKKYKIANLNYSYKNSNYQRKNKESQTKEVLITNC